MGIWQSISNFMQPLLSIKAGMAISAATFVSYVLWVYKKYGVLTSISHSYYEHKEKWRFAAFMTGVGAPLILMWEHWMLALSGALFILCGASPAFKKDDNSWQDELHSIGAEGGIAMAITYFTFVAGQWWTLPVMLIPTLYMMRKKVKNHTWWIEILAFFVIALGMLTM